MNLDTRQSLEAVEEDDLLDINYYKTTKVAVIIRALNHNLRKVLIKTIHENGRLTVTQLYMKLRIEQSIASQHLAILRRAGIVATERVGKHSFYTINEKRVAEINSFAKDIVNYQTS